MVMTCLDSPAHSLEKLVSSASTRALAYRRFMSDSYVSFCLEQARELRRHTAAPITTNGHNPRYQRIDYAELFRGLDVVGTDSCADPNHLLSYASEADWMRPLGYKPRKPFWLAERGAGAYAIAW
jgi:hypothetical protein